MIEKSSEPTRSTRLWACASLVLNVGLAVWLLRHPFASPASVPPHPVRPEATNSPRYATSTPAAVAPVAENNSTPFLWSEIESGDYRQYVANLRAIGCPEQVIRDIILADVSQLFHTRAAAIWQPRIAEYWQKTINDSPDPNQRKQLGALAKEQNSVMRGLLADAPGMQSLVDTLYLQIHGSEQQLLFLPPDRRQAAINLLDRADFEIKEREASHGRDYSPAAERKMFETKMKLLADVLSPEELEEFRLRYSPTAQHLQMELEYFNCTTEEFKKFVALREQTPDGTGAGADMLNRTAATEEVRKLFGEERAKEFERVTDMFYINTRRPAEKQGIPLDRVELAWQVTREARTSAELAAKNSALPAAERRQQVQALQREAETKLIDLLGENASASVRRDLRVVLGATEAQVRE